MATYDAQGRGNLTPVALWGTMHILQAEGVKGNRVPECWGPLPFCGEIPGFSGIEARERGSSLSAQAVLEGLKPHV